MTFGCPCPGDVGNEQKGGFIEKYEMSAQPFSVFLYGATESASTGRLLPCLAAMPGAPVFDNSTSSLSTASRHGCDDTERRNARQSPRRHAATSKGPSGNRPPRRHSKAPFPGWSPGILTDGKVNNILTDSVIDSSPSLTGV